MSNDQKIQTVQQFVPQLDLGTALRDVDDFLTNETIPLDIKEKVSFNGGAIWNDDVPRSTGRKAHAWFFLRQINAAAQKLCGEQRFAVVQRIVEIIPNWQASTEMPQSMAFHDETTAQRVINFSVFQHKFAAEIAQLKDTRITNLLQHDIQLLKSDSFHAGLNNHGMFQDIALLVAEAYDLTDSAGRDLALERLLKYFNASFTSEGIHTENNPSYHLMVAEFVKKVILYLDENAINDQDGRLHSLMEKADRYAAFALTPFGNFVPISDTNSAPISDYRAERFRPGGELLAAVTNGRKGTLPPTNNFVAPESGYAITRSGWVDKKDSYLFFSAAYNDDYHKHSDELSIYFAAHGTPILVEAGPNGYQYDDPLTKYAFSSAAHNTLLVDGAGLPRIDGKASLTTLTNHSTDDAFRVTGQTKRFDGVTWSRTVSALPSLDGGLFHIDDQIRSDQSHEYRLLWHLAPNIAANVRGSFIEMYDRKTERKICELYCSSNDIQSIQFFEGQRHPRVQGFSFPKMGTSVSSTCIEYEFNAQNATVNWEVRTENFLLKDRGVTPFNSEWHTFYGEKPVRYLLDLPDNGDPDKLLVVFSAVNPTGDFTYNYRASLADYSGAVMYILDDFGDQGSYYLASNRNFAEFRSVQGAIRSVIQQLDIKCSAVTTLGSSKGGTAALLHGVSLGAAKVLAAAPQYRIGDFTASAHPNILEHVSGGTSDHDVYWFNHICEHVLRSGSRDTKIVILVGDADGHYRHHAVPLVDDSRALGYRTSLLILPGVPHSQLGGAFRQFATSFAREHFSDASSIVGNASSSNGSTYGIAVDIPNGYHGLAQLQVDGKSIGKAEAIRGGHHRWVVPHGGVARARVYLVSDHDGARHAFGTSPIRFR